MKYPWGAFGITHKDLGFPLISALIRAMTVKSGVKLEIQKFAMKLGPDPVATMANAEKTFAEMKAKVDAGAWDETFLPSIEAGLADVRSHFGCWQFWTSILAGMEG